MKYLVLQRFRTFGKELTKGQVVYESEIRSPLLRRSEGKIVPAVSSSEVPVEFEEENSDSAPQEYSEGSDIKKASLLNFIKQ